MAITIVDPAAPGADHVESYWAATAGPEVENTPPVAGDMEVDIAVIGGGYTGLSTAYHLAKHHGLTAHVLEANRIGWGCSGRNGGFCSVGIGKAGPADWIRRYGLDEARRILDQTRDAVRLVAGLIAAEGIDAEATPEGALELAHKPNRIKGITTGAAFARNIFGLDSRLLGKAELERDYLVSTEAHGAVLHAEGFALHAMKYARGLARAAQKHGAELHAASPVSEWSRDGKRHLLRTPGGTVRARQVVIAGNGYTGDRLHRRIAGRLLPVLSNIIVTRPLDAAERQAVNWQTHLKIWDSRNLLFYYRLLPDNRVLFGARGGIENTPQSRAERRAWLERRFREMFPPLAGVGTDYFWNGWVCATYDKSPHLNTIEDGSVHFALGYIGNGVALSNYCGLLLADRLAGKAETRPSKLLAEPLPGFPFPAFRRLYQRAIYRLYEFQDERL
jgi:gamma-glutamylputrescine oxidase